MAVDPNKPPVCGADVVVVVVDEPNSPPGLLAAVLPNIPPAAGVVLEPLDAVLELI